MPEFYGRFTVKEAVTIKILDVSIDGRVLLETQIADAPTKELWIKMGESWQATLHLEVKGAEAKDSMVERFGSKH